MESATAQTMDPAKSLRTCAPPQPSAGRRVVPSRRHVAGWEVSRTFYCTCVRTMSSAGAALKGHRVIFGVLLVTVHVDGGISDQVVNINVSVRAFGLLGDLQFQANQLSHASLQV